MNNPLVGVTGLKPATSSSQMKHSIKLSYTPIYMAAHSGLEPEMSESKSDVLTNYTNGLYLGYHIRVV